MFIETADPCQWLNSDIIEVLVIEEISKGFRVMAHVTQSGLVKMGEFNSYEEALEYINTVNKLVF